MTSTELRKTLNISLKETLDAYGFSYKKSGYYQAERNFGFDQITFEIKKDSGSVFRFSYVVRRRFERIESLLSPYLEAIHLQPEIMYDTLTFNKTTLDPKLYHPRSSNMAQYAFHATSEGAQNFVRDFASDLDTIIFPTLKTYESIQALDNLINNPPETMNQVFYLFSQHGMLFKN